LVEPIALRKPKCREHAKFGHTKNLYVLRDNLGPGLKFRRILLYYRMNARRSIYIVVFLVEDDFIEVQCGWYDGIFIT
jgi:hypothetical protein